MTACPRFQLALTYLASIQQATQHSWQFRISKTNAGFSILLYIRINYFLCVPTAHLFFVSVHFISTFQFLSCAVDYTSQQSVFKLMFEVAYCNVTLKCKLYLQSKQTQFQTENQTEIDIQSLINQSVHQSKTTQCQEAYVEPSRRDNMTSQQNTGDNARQTRAKIKLKKCNLGDISNLQQYSINILKGVP